MYELIQQILKLKDLKLPAFPANTKLRADWRKMFAIWFFEKTSPLPHVHWTCHTLKGHLTKFLQESPYCFDIVNSFSFSKIQDEFLKLPDNRRQNPLTIKFSFTGPGSKSGNYSWVEWFIGYYSAKIKWEKKKR